MSKKKQTTLEYTLAAVDKFSAPMRRFNKRVSESTKGIREIRKASANLKQESGWNKLAYRVGVLKKRIGSVAREIKALAVKFVAATAAAAGGLLAIVNSTATAGDHIAKTSRKLGLSTTALQELTYAAERGGVEVSTFEMAFQRFGRRAGEAFMGKGEAVTALKQLGINLKDSSGKMRGVDSLFMDVAESLSCIENPAIRNALAMKLFDSEGVKLVQMLDGGREGLAAMRREAHRYGNVLSGPTTKASEAYMDTMTNLKAAFNGIKNIIGEELMPVVADLAKQLGDFIVEHQEEIREWVHGIAVSLPMAFKKLRLAAIAVWKKLEAFGTFIRRMSDIFGGVNLILAVLAAVIFGPLIAAFAALIPVIYSLGVALLTTPIGWFILGVTALVGIPLLIIKNWDVLAEFFSGMWDRIVHDFFGVVDMFKSGISKFTSWLPDWMTGKKKIEVKVNRTEGDDAAVRTGRPTVGAGRMMRNRYGRQGIVDRQEQKATVTVKLLDAPRGTRVSQKGDVPVDVSMGYAMTMPQELAVGWKENIASPSFRGVPFEVESDELNGGRRTATHEYPLRDVPYTEDMGLKARGFSLSAFVVGADYFARRDKLVAALEDDGPGLLVHPQYGRIEVVVQTFRVSHSTDKGGMAQFQMAFVVAGKQVTPGRAMRTQDHVWDKSGTASSVAVSTLDSKFTLSGVPSFVTTSSHAAFVETVERIGEVRTALLDGAAFAKSLGALVGMSASTLSTISPGTELGGLLLDDGLTSLADLNLPATRMQEMLTLAATAPARVAAVIATPSRLIEASNTNALSDFLRQMAASEAARAAAAVTPETKADADRMTVQVTDAIDTVLETTADDAVFTAFSDLRTVTVRDLSERARQAKRLRTFTPMMTGPALVVAHRACDEGAKAADDLVTRNAIRHPGFVGVEPLEVISA